MVTIDNINDSVEKITRKLKGLNSILENIWEAARNSDLRKVMSLVDSAQSYAADSLSSVKIWVEMLGEDAAEVIHENEKIPELESFLEYRDFVNLVKREVNRITNKQ